jgi:hypothetical protein
VTGKQAMTDDEQKAGAADLDAYEALAWEAGALADAADQGPWGVDGAGDIMRPGDPDEREERLLFASDPSARFRPENSDFIAHARTSVPAMRDAILAIAEEMRRLRAGLGEALDEWECAGSYKGDYLVWKHGDAERIAELRALLPPAQATKRDQ